ncbi:Neuropeptide-Like Protein [Caenorhabditis elegans]|uniref:Neuropeptide-Like Protein n=1 Tax=Caenorhabditis elegans TaxID=6239 RepID=Q9GYR3_CAEEL|nr:Neuropeptide-Like Protein [Caenorhabditis elegans]CCD65305.1 Neuropeptide-Like Protein [Caenorhabditis elegans]|eukprot:NP_498354.1 Uncharacterized protein CELE_C23G10.11 [Caenorhabditis elegans]
MNLNILAVLLILVVILSECEASTLRDMFTKNIKKRQETTGGMQAAYSKLLPPQVSEWFLRRHF